MEITAVPFADPIVGSVFVVIAGVAARNKLAPRIEIGEERRCGRECQSRDKSSDYDEG